MVPGLPGQKANGDKGLAVGPIETMVPGLPGQKVNGDKGPAAGPIEAIKRLCTYASHAGRLEGVGGYHIMFP